MAIRKIPIARSDAVGQIVGRLELGHEISDEEICRSTFQFRFHGPGSKEIVEIVLFDTTPVPPLVIHYEHDVDYQPLCSSAGGAFTVGNMTHDEERVTCSDCKLVLNRMHTDLAAETAKDEPGQHPMHDAVEAAEMQFNMQQLETKTPPVLAFNQTIVQCKQQFCRFYGEERVISLPLVGHGVHVNGLAICECGFAPTILRTSD